MDADWGEYADESNSISFENSNRKSFDFFDDEVDDECL